jgi:hypothetical protein
MKTIRSAVQQLSKGMEVACAAGHVDVVMTLLSARASPHCYNVDCHRHTVVQTTTTNGITCDNDHGGQSLWSESWCTSPLFDSVRNNHLELVRLLCSHGARPSALRPGLTRFASSSDYNDDNVTSTTTVIPSRTTQTPPQLLEACRIPTAAAASCVYSGDVALLQLLLSYDPYCFTWPTFQYRIGATSNGSRHRTLPQPFRWGQRGEVSASLPLPLPLPITINTRDDGILERCEMAFSRTSPLHLLVRNYHDVAVQWLVDGIYTGSLKLVAPTQSTTSTRLWPFGETPCDDIDHLAYISNAPTPVTALSLVIGQWLISDPSIAPRILNTVTLLVSYGSDPKQIDAKRFALHTIPQSVIEAVNEGQRQLSKRYNDIITVLLQHTTIGVVDIANIIVDLCSICSISEGSFHPSWISWKSVSLSGSLVLIRMVMQR